MYELATPASMGEREEHGMCYERLRPMPILWLYFVTDVSMIEVTSKYIVFPMQVYSVNFTKKQLCKDVDVLVSTLESGPTPKVAGLAVRLSGPAVT